MKIAIISPNRTHLDELGGALRAHGHRVLAAEGGKSRMRSLADEERPDLMFVDGMCCDTAELVLVEQVTAAHPTMAVILLCAMQTPEFLICSMRAGVREVLPSPPALAQVEAAVARVGAKLAGTRGATPGRVLGLVSCKGGSGATFLATNLGWQLAESRAVLLIDLNLQFGDALSFVFDGHPTATIADVARDITRLDATLLAASAVKVAPNFSILAAPEDLAQAMEVRPEHVDAIIDVAVTQYDFVLLDLPRSVDPVAIRAFDRARRIYVVMQSALPHVRNAARLLHVFKSLGYPTDKTSLIVNRVDRTSSIGLDQIRRSLGQVQAITVPNSYREVSAAIDRGDALVKTARTSAVTRQLAELALTLDPRPEDSRGLLDRLFRRA
jgi:pilus assembly protein CpaE